MSVLSFDDEGFSLVANHDDIVLLFEERSYTLPSYTLSFHFQFESFFAYNATGWSARLTSIMLHIAILDQTFSHHKHEHYDRSEWFALLIRYYYRQYYRPSHHPHLDTVRLRYLIGEGQPHTSWLMDHGFFTLSSQRAELLSVQPGYHDVVLYLNILHMLTFWQQHCALLWQDCLRSHDHLYLVTCNAAYFQTDYLWIHTLEDLQHHEGSDVDSHELPVLIF